MNIIKKGELNYMLNKIDWIKKYGSEHLKKCFDGGYNCNGQYVQERINLELGQDWIIDFKEKAIIKERTSPSMKSLLIVDELKEKGFISKVKYLKKFESFINEEIVFLHYLNKNIFLIIK